MTSVASRALIPPTHDDPGSASWGEGPTRSIVHATPSHAAELAEVHTAAWRWAYADILPAEFLASLSLEARRARWFEILSDASVESRTWCLVDSVRVIGFVSEGPSRDPGASKETGEVLSLYQRPEVAATGVGAALMRHAERALVARGFTHAVLWVLDANTRGRRAYERLGWLPDGATRVDSVGGAQALHLRYARDLGDTSTSTGVS